MTPEDWAWIRKEVARIRAEYEEGDESPMEHIMTSVGYVDLYASLVFEAEVVVNGKIIPECDWPEVPDGNA